MTLAMTSPSWRSIIVTGLLAAISLMAPVPAYSAGEDVPKSERAACSTCLADAEQVVELIERSRTLRDKIPAFVDEAGKAIDAHHGALPAAYSVRIAKAIAEANTIRTSLFQHALRHRNALYRMDDGLSDGDRINSILVSMSAALTLFDNMQFVQQQLAGNYVLRDKLNEAYPEAGTEGNYYDDSLLRANSLTYRAAMLDAIRFFHENEKTIAYHMSHADKNIRTLYEYVEHSPSRKSLGGDSAFRQISDQLGILLQRSVVGSIRQVGKLKFLTSQVVGNTLGMVRWRNGKLKNDREFLALLSANLQPGDILLEKTPFALTDKTIPGHFGHAAIYIGTANQLRSIGALDLPLVQQHMERIESGHVVLEALRGGVVLNTLAQFMNIDDIAVLRPRHLSQESLRESISLALSNYDKRYDFNFDVNTTETIVCSELVYATYPQIDFVTRQVFSSFTISPDDIARLSSGDPADPLELTFFAHDGKLVYPKESDSAGIALFRKLVGLKEKQRQALVTDE